MRRSLYNPLHMPDLKTLRDYYPKQQQEADLRLLHLWERHAIGIEPARSKGESPDLQGIAPLKIKEH
jgi:hypothetical protein